MTASARFPLDLTELTIFRVVKDRLGGTAQALHFFWLLWRELAQLVGQGEPVGRMKRINLEVFLGLLIELQFFPSKDAAMSFLTDPVLQHGLLQADGDDYVCLRFINLNADMALRGKKESLGGLLKAFDQKQKKLADGELELGLKTPERIWVDEHDNPLPEDIQGRIQRLIVTCDNALKRERPPIGWNEGLVQQAIPVIKRYSDEEIYYICRKIVTYRNHPRLAGYTTERLLPVFHTILPELGG